MTFNVKSTKKLAKFWHLLQVSSSIWSRVTAPQNHGNLGTLTSVTSRFLLGPKCYPRRVICFDFGFLLWTEFFMHSNKIWYPVASVLALSFHLSHIILFWKFDPQNAGFWNRDDFCPNFEDRNFELFFM